MRRQIADSRSMLGGFGFARPMLLLIASLAGEIVGADGMAQIGPAGRAPVLDEARVAYQGLEPLGLAKWRVRRGPKTNGGCASNLAAAVSKFLDTIQRPDMGIDEAQVTREFGKALRRGHFCRSASQKPRRLLHDLPWSRTILVEEQRVRSPGVLSLLRIDIGEQNIPVGEMAVHGLENGGCPGVLPDSLKIDGGENVEGGNKRIKAQQLLRGLRSFFEAADISQEVRVAEEAFGIVGIERKRFVQ